MKQSSTTLAESSLTPITANLKEHFQNMRLRQKAEHAPSTPVSTTGATRTLTMQQICTPQPCRACTCCIWCPPQRAGRLETELLVDVEQALRRGML